MPGLVLQMWRRPAAGVNHSRPAAGDIRYGLTASRRVGNAVARNRVRRRLRAAAERVLPACAQPGCDYVLIGRAGTLVRPFPALVADLTSAIDRLSRTHRRRTAGRSTRP